MKKIMMTLTLVSAIASIDMIHASAPAAAAAGAGADAASLAHGDASNRKEAHEGKMLRERTARTTEKAMQKLSDQFIETFRAVSSQTIETYFTEELFVYPPRPPYDQMINIKIPYVRIDKLNWAHPICAYHFVLAQFNALQEEIVPAGNKCSDEAEWAALAQSIPVPLNPHLDKILKEELAAKEKREKLMAADASAAYPT